MNKTNVPRISIYLLLLLTACQGELKKTGGAWEVMVIAPNDSIAKVATDSLGAPDTLLPQPEPMLDVRVMAEKSSMAIRHRNLVDLTGISNPNWGELRREIISKERQRMKIYLAKHHNKEAEETIKQTFGIEMMVPEEMNKTKRAKDFVWLSNGTAKGMTNLCVYRLKTTGEISEDRFRELRDSVMKQNIPGEKDGMYMSTTKVRGTMIEERGERLRERLRVGASAGMGEFCSGMRREERGERCMVRGLWEMRGDMMGGPFTATMTRTPEGWIVKEVFVYAPEGKKRNLIRRIEAAIY